MNTDVIEALGTGVMVAGLFLAVYHIGSFLYNWAMKQVKSVTISPGKNLMR